MSRVAAEPETIDPRAAPEPLAVPFPSHRAPTPAPATTSPHASDRSPPPTAAEPEQRWRPGTGLFVGAGAAGLVAWSLEAYLIAVTVTRCSSTLPWERCLIDLQSTFGPVVARSVANLTSIGLAAGGGVLRGRDERRRGTPMASRRFIVGGAVTLGVGLAGAIALRPTWVFTVSDRCVHLLTTSGGPDAANACFRRRTAGYLVGLQLMASAVAAGAGVLAFGLRHRGPRRRRLRMAPVLSPGYQGLSLSAAL